MSLAHPDLKATPDVTEFRVHRALLDRRGLQVRRASPDLQDQRVRKGLRDHPEGSKRKRRPKDSPAPLVPWVLKDHPVQPARRGRRALPGTRDPKARRECRGRAASLDHAESLGRPALLGHPDRLEAQDWWG